MDHKKGVTTVETVLQCAGLTDCITPEHEATTANSPVSTSVHSLNESLHQSLPKQETY